MEEEESTEGQGRGRDGGGRGRSGRDQVSLSPGVRFDLRVFDQDRIWVDASGGVVRLAELGWRDRRVLRAWLREHAQHFYLAVLQRELVAMVRVLVEDDDVGGGRFGWGKAGSGVQEQSSRSVPGDRFSSAGSVPDIVFVSAGQWLESTPLFRELVHRRRR